MVPRNSSTPSLSFGCLPYCCSGVCLLPSQVLLLWWRFFSLTMFCLVGVRGVVLDTLQSETIASFDTVLARKTKDDPDLRKTQPGFTSRSDSSTGPYFLASRSDPNQEHSKLRSVTPFQPVLRRRVCRRRIVISHREPNKKNEDINDSYPKNALCYQWFAVKQAMKFKSVLFQMWTNGRCDFHGTLF